MSLYSKDYLKEGGGGGGNDDQVSESSSSSSPPIHSYSDHVLHVVWRMMIGSV